MLRIRSGRLPLPSSIEEEIVAELGQVYDPYTGRCSAHTSDTTAEHVVALSEAHDSGLCAADEAARKEFARDLLNLTLASPAVNSAKGDRDATEWLPDENRCWFAAGCFRFVSNTT